MKWPNKQIRFTAQAKFKCSQSEFESRDRRGKPLRYKMQMTNVWKCFLAEHTRGHVWLSTKVYIFHVHMELFLQCLWTMWTNGTWWRMSWCRSDLFLALFHETALSTAGGSYIKRKVVLIKVIEQLHFDHDIEHRRRRRRPIWRHVVRAARLASHASCWRYIGWSRTSPPVAGPMDHRSVPPSPSEAPVRHPPRLVISSSLCTFLERN